MQPIGVMGIPARCDAGCNEAFTVREFKVEHLQGGVEKTYFTCPHCLREYVAFYTDGNIRSLQERLRKTQARFADPKFSHDEIVTVEVGLKRRIKEAMDKLRAIMEGG